MDNCTTKYRENQTDDIIATCIKLLDLFHVIFMLELEHEKGSGQVSACVLCTV